MSKEELFKGLCFWVSSLLQRGSGINSDSEATAKCRKQTGEGGPHAALFGSLMHTAFYPPEVIPEFYLKNYFLDP